MFYFLLLMSLLKYIMRFSDKTGLTARGKAGESLGRLTGTVRLLRHSFERGFSFLGQSKRENI
jgi:hypothetical protein